MKLVTYNIRFDGGLDGNNNFCYRQPLILKKITEENPDIICFQEVLEHVADWLKENLTEYVVVGCGREADLGGEQMTVAYKRSNFNMMRMETYWMSETPYVPGSRHKEQSMCPRTCTELVLFEKESGKIFRVINTHLDHEGAAARIRGLEQILKKLDEENFFPGVPVVVAGDFNVEPDGEELQVILNAPGFVDATEGIGATWHDFMRQPDCKQIDYVFIRGEICCEGVEKWTDEDNGVYLSDHFPVSCILKLK